jgi:uncharacterized protein YndB with AHSA1/START domain
MADPISGPTRLEIHHKYNAPRERVFRAWTEPDLLKQWFLPAPGFTAPIAEVDLRVGGRFRIGIRSADRASIATGIYLQIQPPEKLVFTWAWDHEPEIETLVTLELIAAGDQTELVLIHENFVKPEIRDDHIQGWSACLTALGRVFKEQEV